MPALTGSKLTRPPATVPIGTAKIRSADGHEQIVEIRLSTQWEQALDKLFQLVNANL